MMKRYKVYFLKDLYVMIDAESYSISGEFVNFYANSFITATFYKPKGIIKQ